MIITSFERIARDGSLIVFYFKIFDKGKETVQRIVLTEGEIIKRMWSCSCEFGSTFRFSKENSKKDIKCKHIAKCISLLKYLDYIKNHG